MGRGYFLKHLFILIGVCLGASSGRTQADPLNRGGQLYGEGKLVEAIQEYQGMPLKDLSPQQLSLRSLALGVWMGEKGEQDKAKTQLQESLKTKSLLAYYANYLLGLNAKTKGLVKESKGYFQKTLALKPPRNIIYSTRFELSDLAIKERKWKQAYRHLKYLDRRWRNTDRHPEVLFRLIKVELERKRKWRACRWARKIYSKYPTHPLIYDWSIDLQSNRFEGKRLRCLASHRDQRSRIRRLQWNGQADRARREISTLMERSRGSTAYAVDSLLANFLVKEGFVDEALKILLKHYSKQKKNFSYLMLLGKAAARASEYQTAVGAYHKAHQLNPRSRAGRLALYRAAFLSYQFQDYDGAARKFEEYRRQHPRSGLSRDSSWHLAWIQYLKGDYEGAIQGFKKILWNKKRFRRRWRKFSHEKIQYWLAMSYFRQNKFKEAGPLFRDLIKDKSLGFYSHAAQQRYNSIPGIQPVKDLVAVVNQEGWPSLHSQEENADPPETLENSSKEESERTPASEKEEEESEETLATTGLDEDNNNEEAESETEADEDSEKDEEPDEDSVNAVEFADSHLQKRFDRAQQLILIGLKELANWELYELERRTRNPAYLKRLMKAYEEIGSYHRSAYIGEIFFAPQRQSRGIYGVKELWQFTYPQAFHPFVSKYAGQFNVPKEFIWAIMRAESHYRTQIISPVGAKGLMQLMPHTGRQVARLLGESAFHERQLAEPEVNIRLGTRYLNRLMKKMEGQLPLVAASYNAGPHRVEAWLNSFGQIEMDEFIEHIPFIETRNYVKKVIKNYGIYEALYSEKPVLLAWLDDSIPVKASRRPSPRETWEALEGIKK